MKIVNFLAWVQNQRDEVLQGIKRLISDDTGLTDENGADIFKGSFPYMQGRSAQDIYDDVCETVFLGSGQLLVSHLTGSDELQLSVGDANPFGVINVGQASKLYAKFAANKSRPFSIAKDAFSKPLFAAVDRDHSPVNIVIGARKFVAGWNSWRVSTMGLMHVGTGEGPQIIQMFGRGVRLKGYDMSLKRHTQLKGIDVPGDGHQLMLLETLNIFGLRANYMEKFKDYLQKEGIKVDRITLVLPTKKQFKNVEKLKVIRRQKSAGEFQYSERRLDLPAEADAHNVISLDRYRNLQILQSKSGPEDRNAAVLESRSFDQRHLSSINKRFVYHRVLQRKQRLGWHNMNISQATINRLLDPDNTDWYELHILPEKLKPGPYNRVREWENLAVDLITEYADKHWRKARNKWEHDDIEAKPLSHEDVNYVERYELAVAENEASLIEDLEQLAIQLKNDSYGESFVSGNVQLSLLTPSFHAYRPLLYADLPESVHITPVPLNQEEAKFVTTLKGILDHQDYQEFLLNKEIYLMRNLSRGKGISFFDDYAFYPDFILWITGSNRQDVLFIDPKGLVHYDSRVQRKVRLHKRIKDTEKKIQQKNPNLFLHSYIWSSTLPKRIGSTQAMTLEQYHQEGIFFVSHNAHMELLNLLQHALDSV